ncbi:penicillin acylase family protein [Sediminibacterium sp. KACHI17]|jgi:penicillin G amidase|uniref:Penicillin acylase family protein n=1 Tax=Sediminibacterium sp. KACHI17 TaxID=1751071 RepID=A0AAT9GHA0_9BACT
MRIVPMLVSVIATTGLIITLNTQLPVGGSKTPRLGYFLSPQKGFWQNAEPADASHNAEITLTGIKSKVEVFMDERLVPHIYAENDADAYYAQGYLHAKYRLWQMEFQTHVAAGRLSEIVGPDRIDTDKYFRRMGMVYAAEKTMREASKNKDITAAMEAYANGVNDYIRSLEPHEIPFEYKLLDYQPEEWTPFKTYLFLMFMSYDLTGRGISSDLQMTNAKNYFGYEDFDQLFTNVQDSLDPIIPKGTVYPAAAIPVTAPADVDSVYLGKTNTFNTATPPMIPDKNNGSNNWAVSGTKTKSGRPILANDPHLGLNLPSLWYEVQITTPTHSTYGASFPGSPAVIIGFNDSIAWGVTNAGRDVIDFYDMKFKDSTLEQYWYNGLWNKADIKEEVIKVKGQPDIIDRVAYTALGPVMYDASYKNDNTVGKYLAVKWTAHDGGQGLQTFYELNHAKNFDDYLNAINKWTCPGQNFAFISKTGDIAIKQQGAFVARWKRQGDFIMPGDDTRYMWQGIIPNEENPMQKNPERGFISSANQRSTDDTYPYYLGAAADFPLYRGIIINKRLAAMSNITAEDMQRLQTDNYNVFAEMARPALMKFVNEAALDADGKKYLSILKDWNLRNDIGEKGATVFRAIWDSLETTVWKDEFEKSKLALPWPDEPVLLEVMLRDSVYYFADNANTPDKTETLYDAVMTAIKKASIKCKELEKKNELEWGKFKDTRVSHLLKIDPLSRLHLPIGGGVHIINATTKVHGPSWRMIVHMTDDIEAYGVYPGGQSGNPGSKYYDSFVDSWAAGKYYRILFLKKEAAEKSNQIKWRITFNN